MAGDDDVPADVPPFHPDQLDLYLRRRRRGAGGVYIALILLLIGTAASLPLVEVPISVRAQGVLRAAAESHSLIVPLPGDVGWVDVRDGQHVERGDTLLLLDRPDLRIRLEAVRARRAMLEREQSDLEKLVVLAEVSGSGLRPASLRYQDEWRSVVGELRSVAGRLRARRQEAFRSAALFERGLTAAAEHAAVEDQVRELTQDSLMLRLRAASRWRGELARLHQELRDLLAEEAAVADETEQLAVTAPVAGILSEAAALAVGSFVPAGERVARLTPTSPLVAELYVRPDELDAIRPGSQVRMRLASRRYGGSGALTGTVIAIDPELFRASGGSVGRLRVAPRLPADGRGVSVDDLRRGSSLTARIPVARRSLWALLRYRREALQGGSGRSDAWGDPAGG